MENQLEFVLARLPKRQADLRIVAEEVGMSFGGLQKVHLRLRKDPKYSTVFRLYQYLKQNRRRWPKVA